jgi:hypothetical protein
VYQFQKKNLTRNSSGGHKTKRGKEEKNLSNVYQLPNHECNKCWETKPMQQSGGHHQKENTILCFNAVVIDEQ